MFKISEFSKIAQVSGHLLRHYDDIGLLKPDQIDPWTGYRYYRAAQLPRLNRILALKDLGLSLEQIRRIVEDEISGDEIRSMLRLRKAQIEQTLQAEMTRLRHVEARLEQIDQEGSLDNLEVVVKSVAAQPFLSTRYLLPSFAEGPALVREMMQKVAAKIGERRIRHFAAIFHSDMFCTENIDLEVGLILTEPVAIKIPFRGEYTLTLHTLPAAAQMATAVQHEVHRIGHKSYASIGIWMELHEYQFDGPGRELLLVPPGTNDETLVELQFPIVHKTYPLPTSPSLGEEPRFPPQTGEG